MFLNMVNNGYKVKLIKEGQKEMPTLWDTLQLSLKEVRLVQVNHMN